MEGNQPSHPSTRPGFCCFQVTAHIRLTDSRRKNFTPHCARELSRVKRLAVLFPLTMGTRATPCASRRSIWVIFVAEETEFGVLCNSLAHSWKQRNSILLFYTMCQFYSQKQLTAPNAGSEEKPCKHWAKQRLQTVAKSGQNSVLQFRVRCLQPLSHPSRRLLLTAYVVSEIGYSCFVSRRFRILWRR